MRTRPVKARWCIFHAHLDKICGLMSKKESQSLGTTVAPDGRTRAAHTAVRSAVAAVGSKVEAAKDDAADAIARSGARAKDVLERVGDSAKDGIQKSGRMAQDAAGSAAQTMQGVHAAAVSPAIGKAQSAIVETKDRLASAADSATQRMEKARESASERWAAVGESLRRRIEADVAGPAKAFAEAAARRLESLGPAREQVVQAAVAVGAATAAAYGKVATASPQFGELSPLLKAKFALAGSRGEWRSLSLSESLYQESVPGAVHNLGETAVWKFLGGKHASHIQSVENAPHLAMDTANIIWEASGANLERGSANMTGLELAKANAANLVDAAGLVAVHALETAALAGCIGMALETVVAVGENLVFVCHGKRSAREAAIDVGKKAAKQGVVAGIGGAAVATAVALGAGPALSAMAPVLITIGGTVYVVSATKRISDALRTCADPQAVELLLLERQACAA